MQVQNLPGFVGQQPALTLGNDGNFYGTSLGGNSSGCGVVFKITPSGTLTLVYNFTCGADGGYPEPGLLLGTDGNLYGTAKIERRVDRLASKSARYSS